jgi:hypothetical protein
MKMQDGPGMMFPGRFFCHSTPNDRPLAMKPDRRLRFRNPAAEKPLSNCETASGLPAWT